MFFCEELLIDDDATTVWLISWGRPNGCALAIFCKRLNMLTWFHPDYWIPRRGKRNFPNLTKVMLILVEIRSQDKNRVSVEKAAPGEDCQAFCLYSWHTAATPTYSSGPGGKHRYLHCLLGIHQPDSLLQTLGASAMEYVSMNVLDLHCFSKFADHKAKDSSCSF